MVSLQWTRLNLLLCKDLPTRSSQLLVASLLAKGDAELEEESAPVVEKGDAIGEARVFVVASCDDAEAAGYKAADGLVEAVKLVPEEELGPSLKDKNEKSS